MKSILIRAASFVCLLLIIPGVCTAMQRKSDAVGPLKYKFMTYNIQASNLVDFLHRWESRKELVLTVINSNNPDVLGLQETLSDRVLDIAQVLGNYACYWAGGDDGQSDGQGCPIFYRLDKFKLVDSGTFWFSDRSDKPGAKGWGNLIPRFCSWVKLSPKTRAGSSFYVYNTHLDSLSQGSREKSVRLLEQEIARRRGTAPFIILGDFNMSLDNPAMEFLLEKNRHSSIELVDAWRTVYPNGPDVATYNTKTRQIDHILLSATMKATSAKVDNRKFDGRVPSDHYPVIADVLVDIPRLYLGK
jgi:endonuclease/exonuclease/phosphatase family metal-dependent hydrolase